jgi:hypothetical protein
MDSWHHDETRSEDRADDPITYCHLGEASENAVLARTVARRSGSLPSAKPAQ